MISVVRMPSVVNNKRCSSRWLDDESRRVYDIVFRSDGSARFSFCDREELRTPTPTQWTRAHGSAVLCHEPFLKPVTGTGRGNRERSVKTWSRVGRVAGRYLGSW